MNNEYCVTAIKTIYVHEVMRWANILVSFLLVGSHSHSYNAVCWSNILECCLDGPLHNLAGTEIATGGMTKHKMVTDRLFHSLLAQP